MGEVKVPEQALYGRKRSAPRTIFQLADCGFSVILQALGK